MLLFKETVESMSAAYERAAQVAEILPTPLGNEFAEKHMYISPEAKGPYTGDWVSRPPQVEILNVFCSTEFSEVSWRKASRLGASKMLIATMVMAAIFYKFNCLTYHPNDPKSDQFVKLEIDPIIRDIPELKKLLGSSKKDDTLEIKQFLGSVWNFLGGATGEAYRALSVDWVFNDELSAFIRDISEEGDGRALSKTRVTESPFGKQINVSSPKVTDECLISEAIDEADFLFRYYTPCPGCGLLQYMDFHEGKEHGIIWNFNKKDTVKNIAKTARYKCIDADCGCESTYSEMQKSLERGKWMTDDKMHWLKDGRIWGFNEEGDECIRNEERWAIGFDSNVFISGSFTFTEFVDEYIKADRKLQAGKPQKMKVVFNNRLSRTWDKDKAIETISYKNIHPVAFPPDGLVPQNAKIITSAADIHKHRIEVLDVAWGPGEESWALDYTVLPGPADKGGVWAALQHHWLNTKYIREDGAEMPLFLKGLDHGGSGSNKDKQEQSVSWLNRLEAFIKVMGVRETLAIKGFLGVDQVGAVLPQRHTRGIWVARMNTDPTKSLIYRRINMMIDPDRDKNNNEGCIWFPLREDSGRYDWMDTRFAKGMTSEVREIHPSGRVEWKTHGKNEPLDLYGMNQTLCTLAQTNRYKVDLDSEILHIPYTDESNYDYAAMGEVLNT